MAAQNLADDLQVVADEADALLQRISNEKIQKPVQAIYDACDELKRSWSGSNLGYHATVYFAGFQPKPPDAQFSSEWGLIEAWPTHEPHRGWLQVDEETVLEEIKRRAGNPDTKALTADLALLRETFLYLQDRARSILSEALSQRSDSFLSEKLDRIGKLSADEPELLAARLMPKGQIFTRDTLALTQGLQLAPHQRAATLPGSAMYLKECIEVLARTAREAASHLKRVEKRNEKRSMVGTNVFIGHGHSPIWRELKDFIEDRLHLPVDEFNSVPVAGVATATRLNELLDAAAFAFIIMTAEDEQLDGKLRARENVVHEVGLFQGRLGFTRAIVLLEDGCEEFSNIHGLGQIRFPRGNISAKFEDIRAVLEREHLILNESI